MGKLKIECEKAGAKLKKLCKKVYKLLGQKENLKADLSFVSKDEIQRLNREFRNKDAVTDVLSFPTLEGIRNKVIDKNDCFMELDGKFIHIGSIAICVDRAREQAEEFGHSLERELVYLTLHSLLHLFGYDHETDEDKLEMREKEKIIVKELKLGE
ncbi:MAG: rRNA maturation RNase YbeY [Clostridiales bacterium]|nr:rRNA maturation RNase YbeY [Clostridiales bacterium]